MLLLLAALALVSADGCPLPLGATPTSPADGATVAGDQAELVATLSDNAGGVATFFGRPIPEPGEPFTIVALPDTQFYSESYPETFVAQTQWIIDQRRARNIVAVLHLGDIVNRAERPEQWDAADAAISVLDSEPNLPYGLAVGNHDEFPAGDPNGTQAFNEVFPFMRYEQRPWYGGHMGQTNDNHYLLFSARELDFIAVFLKYFPGGDPAALAWADDLLKQHADRRAIVVTHFAVTGHILNSKLSGQGRAIRAALGGNPNLFLVLGGHFCGSGSHIDRLPDTTLYSLLADYQCWGAGGDGWLRVLEFIPADNMIHVRTYSPTRDEYLTGPKQDFLIPYEMSTPPAFEQIAAVTVPAGQTEARATWSDLTAGRQYEWFVHISRGGVTLNSTVSRFRTPP